jgi:ubiquinone/menaquinone biosynthesis C-methylase UbiE
MVEIGFPRGPSIMKRRSLKLDKLAQVYDTEILPIWAERFGRMLLAEARIPKKGLVLNVACGTGYPALELLERMDEGRIIAIDSSSALLDVAREKAKALSGKRIFFRSEGGKEKLSFDSEVYDLTFSNLGLDEMEGTPAQAIAELARVTAPGGQLLLTLPLRGTWAEFLDIFREVLTKHDRHDTLEGLVAYEETLPEPEVALKWMEDAGLTRVDLVVDEFSLLFKSSREFFFAPVIEFGPLGDWKRLVGKGQEMQDIFWFIKEAIDAYFGGRAFSVTVVAGCLSGFKPTEAEREAQASSGLAQEAADRDVLATSGKMAALSGGPARGMAGVEHPHRSSMTGPGSFSEPEEDTIAHLDDDPAAEVSAHLRDAPVSVGGLDAVLSGLDGSYTDGFDDDEDTVGMAREKEGPAKSSFGPPVRTEEDRVPSGGGEGEGDALVTVPRLGGSSLPSSGPEEVSIHELGEDDLELLEEDLEEDDLITGVQNLDDLPDNMKKAIRRREGGEPPKGG